MKIQIIKTIITTVVLAVVLFFINKLLLDHIQSFEAGFKLYQFSLPFIYVLLTSFSVVILTTLIVVNSKNKDIVGITFLLMTTVKASILLLIFYKIVTSSNTNTIERVNFFTLFILFLAIETLITIRLLNKKQ